MRASSSGLRAGGEESRGLKFAEACGSLLFSVKGTSVKVPETNHGVSCWGRVCILVRRKECIFLYWFPWFGVTPKVRFHSQLCRELIFCASCLSKDAREVNSAFDGKCVSIAAPGMRTASREEWTAFC